MNINCYSKSNKLYLQRKAGDYEQNRTQLHLEFVYACLFLEADIYFFISA